MTTGTKVMRTLFVILFLQNFISFPCCSGSENEDGDDGPLVQIAQGKLRGVTQRSRDGVIYNAFRNIPYGTAGRFENPKPAGSWEGVYDARKRGEECAQSNLFSHEISGVEDCLKLNIYTPNLKGNYPVMVYIHGGAFTMGTASYYHADYFMDEDVVLVTINYRVGPLGFLSTGDDKISGNFGLKDQSLALQFISNNIGSFGGNPHSVTIFGESAGGAAVSYHVVSPQSKNLFHAAISQSASALNPWALSKNPRQTAQKFAQALGCPLESDKLKACLVNDRSVLEILSESKSLVEWGVDPITKFGPVVEPKNLPGAFLTETPLSLLETGNFHRVPWIIGTTEDEGIFIHSAAILNNPEMAQDFEKNWGRIFPITLGYNEKYGNVQKGRQMVATKKIHNYYFPQNPPGVEESRQAMTDLFGDRLFNHGIHQMAKLAAKFVPVYPFLFAHSRPDFTIIEFLGIKKNYGVTHGDDLSYLFSQAFDMAPDFENNSASLKVSKNFVKLWVSFATNKKPTQLWSSINSWDAINPAQSAGKEPINYLWIDTELSVREPPFVKRLEFWDDLLNTILKDDGGSGGKRDEL